MKTKKDIHFTTIALLFIIGFTSIHLHAQEHSSSKKGKDGIMSAYNLKYQTCEFIKEEVERMTQNNIYKAVSYGLVENKFAVDEAFIRHMLITYNIEIEVMACAVTPSEICYANALNNSINDKFGKDFVNQQYLAFNNNRQ